MYFSFCSEINVNVNVSSITRFIKLLISKFTASSTHIKRLAPLVLFKCNPSLPIFVFISSFWNLVFASVPHLHTHSFFDYCNLRRVYSYESISNFLETRNI